MYLTRMFLDPGSRSVRFDAANPDGLHKTVMRLFPDNMGAEARKAHAVLHRLDEGLDGRLMLLVQSSSKPDTARLLPGYLVDVGQEPDLAFSGIDENPSIRNVSKEREVIGVGDRFLFRLKANTTKKIGTKSGPGAPRVHGQRVPVRGEEARLEWLKRHAEVAGFAFVNVRVRELVPQGRDVRLAGAVFDGVLEVQEASLFLKALGSGIGPAKAFGFGLLSLSRIKRE
jgi:CRISPR system Cascade subunit CasE